MRSLPCALVGALLLSPSLALAAPQVRVVTWNLQAIGDPTSDEYAAAVDVLARLDADVVLLQEVNGTADATALTSLAADTGYTVAAFAGGAPFGSLCNTILTRLDVLEEASLDAATLSGDPAANDITRYVVRARLDVPDAAGDLVVVGDHWKSGWDDDDDLRRTIETRRVVAALDGFDPDVDAVVVGGDMNEEWAGFVGSPATFTALPSGLPASFVLGADLAAELSTGLANDPFAPLEAWGMAPLDAPQRDGSDGTRPSSGRRIDYLWASAVLQADAWTAEVYDDNDEGLAGTLVYAGAPLPAGTVARASDHLPVVADLTLAPDLLDAADLVPGDLVLTELMANPSFCSDTYGEWVEVYNASGHPVDLLGVAVQDATGAQATLATSVRVEAGGYAVLGRATAATWCGATVPAAFWGSRPILDNDGDTVSLVVPATGAIVDVAATYGYGGARDGSSWSLDPASLDATGNDTAANWCSGRPTADAEWGTPGSANASCP